MNHLGFLPVLAYLVPEVKILMASLFSFRQICSALLFEKFLLSQALRVM